MQRPSNVSSPSISISCSSEANSVSDLMSTRQPVRRAARRAFWPSRPIASESWSSGTITVAWRSSSSTITSRTRAGESALATKRAGSSLWGMMSIFSPRSSETTMRTREPRGPTQAPTGSTPSAWEIDGDLRAVAGLTGDADDLDQLVGDLRHLELEQALDQLRAAARDDDRRPFGRVGDVGDHRLDPHPVVVALVVDLLGLGQQRLDPLAQLDQRVALVGLLDDPGDQLADPVLVLVVHHLPLGLADPLQDHLLCGLGGDPAEVFGGDVAGRRSDPRRGRSSPGRARDPPARAFRRSPGRPPAPPAARLPRPATSPPARAAGSVRRRGSRRFRGRGRRGRIWPPRASSCKPRGARPRGRPSACRRRFPSPARAL